MLNFLTLRFTVLSMMFSPLVCYKEPHCSKFHYEEKTLEKMIRMEIEMERILQKMEEMDQTIHSLSHSTTGNSIDRPCTPSVAFFASLSARMSNMAKNQVVIFDKAVLNIGTAYNNRTGEFTAPADGVFFFSTSILADNNAEVWCHFAVNGSKKANIYAHATGGRHDQGSQTIVLQLKLWDVVTVHNSFSNGMIYGEAYSTFSGFLLS